MFLGDSKRSKQTHPQVRGEVLRGVHGKMYRKMYAEIHKQIARQSREMHLEVHTRTLGDTVTATCTGTEAESQQSQETRGSRKGSQETETSHPSQKGTLRGPEGTHQRQVQTRRSCGGCWWGSSVELLVELLCVGFLVELCGVVSVVV